MENELDALDADVLPEETLTVLDQNSNFKEEALAPAKTTAAEKRPVTDHVPGRKKDAPAPARVQQVRTPFLGPIVFPSHCPTSVGW